MTEPWIHHNEIIFHRFFIQNGLECLLHCRESPLTWEQMIVQNKVAVSNWIVNIYDIFEKRIKPLGGCEYPFYHLDLDTFETIIRRAKPAVFNVHLSHILFNLDFIKTIKSPIIYLIRKNNWYRAISEQIMNKKLITDSENKPLYHFGTENHDQQNINIDKQSLIDECENQVPEIKKFQQELNKQSNVKILYYEDVEHEEYWTDQFINELEAFMGVEFVDKNYKPPLVKTRDYLNIVNEDEIMDQQLIKKYYIHEV